MLLALKLDVDTLRGYTQGVPRLLDLFARRGLHASMFFSMGPDNSGKAIRRIFRKGFISKMLRTRAPSTYGIKTMLYGTLLPAPMIADADPDIITRAAAEGHDCGVHAWDHVHVQDQLPSISEQAFGEETQRAFALFARIAGQPARAYAAPGWQATAASLAALDALQLDYMSCTRGRSPYWPVLDGRRHTTLELPTTLPTMDEIYGANGIDDTTLPDAWARDLTEDGLNVLTFHAEMEGMSKLHVFDAFLDRALDRGARIITLREAAALLRADAQPCTVADGYLPGRAGTLALQGAVCAGA